MSTIVCKGCRGKGHRPGYDDHGGAMRCVLEECDNCKGRGEVCATCEGKGYRHRVPDGFNAFSAGGWNTINAMYRVPCSDCSATADASRDTGIKSASGTLNTNGESKDG